MANGVPAKQITDLVNHSLAHFHARGTWEAEFDFQEYIVCDHWLKQARMNTQSGNQIEWRVMFDDSGAFRYVDLFEQTPTDYVDLFVKATSPWVYAETKATYEAHLMTQMRGESELVDYLRSRYFAAIKPALDGLERSLVGLPLNANDTKSPRGIFYWMTKLGAGVDDPVGGFNGPNGTWADGSAKSDVGGLDRSLYPLAANWAATKSGIDMTFIDTLRRGVRFSSFMVPTDIRQYYRTDRRPSKRLYSGLDEQVQYERLVNAGPDDRNGDVNPFYGTLTFRGIPWYGLPALDEDPDNPVICVDINNFKPVVHADWWFKRDEPLRTPARRHLWEVGFDFQFNTIMESPRKGGIVIHDVIAN